MPLEVVFTLVLLSLRRCLVARIYFDIGLVEHEALTLALTGTLILIQSLQLLTLNGKVQGCALLLLLELVVLAGVLMTGEGHIACRVVLTVRSAVSLTQILIKLTGLLVFISTLIIEIIKVDGRGGDCIV